MIIFIFLIYKVGNYTGNIVKDVFTGICKNKNHSLRLNYFCKTHNQLCCAQCITIIKDKDNGQHNNCDICTIEDIKSVKKNKLQDNIQC
jgi:hypothetical protein